MSVNEREKLLKELQAGLSRLEKAVHLQETIRRGEHIRWQDKNFWARQKGQKYLLKNRGDI